MRVRPSTLSGTQSILAVSPTGYKLLVSIEFSILCIFDFGFLYIILCFKFKILYRFIC